MCVILVIISIPQQLIFTAEMRTSEEADVFSTTSSAGWRLSSGSQKRPEWERRREREGQQRREASARNWFFHRRRGQRERSRGGAGEREREDRVIWGDEGDKGGGETFGRRDKERGVRVLGEQQQRGECGAHILSVKLLSQSDPAQVGAPPHSVYFTHTHA